LTESGIVVSNVKIVHTQEEMEGALVDFIIDDSKISPALLRDLVILLF